jgi:hypothetical protein
VFIPAIARRHLGRHSIAGSSAGGVRLNRSDRRQHSLQDLDGAGLHLR